MEELQRKMLALQEMLSMEEEEEDYLPESPNIEADNTSDEFGLAGKRKSRGRPRKSADGSIPTPRKRGRPPEGKKKLNSKIPFYDPETGMMVVPVKRPRGRPRKHPRPEEDYTTGSGAGEMNNSIYHSSSQDSSPSFTNEDSSNSDESSDFAVQNSNVKLLIPSDYQITSRIKDLVNTLPTEQQEILINGNNCNLESNNCDTEQLRGRLEEHFGVNLQCRQFFIQEAYDILSY